MKVWSLGCRRRENDTNAVSEGAEIKSLSFLDLTVIGVGSSLGVGISVLIGGLIKNVTGPAVVVSTFLAGVTALIGGLCCAEFGVQFLKVDSAYCYSYFWGRDNIAFIFGWALILEYVAGTASVVKGIVTFIDTLSDCKISDFLKNSTSTNFPEVFPYFDFLSLAIVAVITTVVALGVKDSLIVKKLFTLCNIVLIASIIISGSFKADLRNWQVGENTDEKPKGFAPFGILSVIKGATVAFYGFIGIDTASISGEEIKKRKRNLPLVILVTTLVALVTYIGVGVILTFMVPFDELNPFAAVPFAFQRAGWISFKWVVVAASFFGFQTSLFGIIFPLPRIIRSMANDGLLFGCLGNCHSKLKTPTVASLIGGLMTAAAAGIFPFEKLVNLTVIGALFVYTVLAINLILLRYSPKSENEDKMCDSWKNLIKKNSKVSVKTVIQNYFNFKGKHPTKLTKIIITGNLVLFCISSIGISIIFNIFYDRLVKSSAEVIVPSSILLSVMFFNLISISCQPKSHEFIPYKVSLVPFIPCLSIFLNTFLMLTFESITWILFFSWMGIGIILHFFLRFLKCFRGEVNKNSLYNINRTNVVKLNEAIWKIKSDKKFFYEGAVNPVFSDDIEDKSNQVVNNGIEIKKSNEKTSLQLKQAEIIQTAESIVVEKTEPLKNDLELNFIRISDTETGNNFQEEEEKVHWECVAEIHTEEELPQESIALEIVDNTYNFLSEVSEDLIKDESSEKIIETTFLKEKYSSESITPENDTFKGTDKTGTDLGTAKLQADDQELFLNHNELITSNQINELNDQKKNEEQSFKEELLNKIQTRKKDKGIKESDSEDIQLTVLQENETKILNVNIPEDVLSKNSAVSKSLSGRNQNQEFINLIVETFYKPHTSETTLYRNKQIEADSLEAEPSGSVSDEQNKKKFKEKLNQLLKNQINSSATVTKNSFPVPSFEADNLGKNNEKNNEALHYSVKTLNKSQIKGKLELLLSKGPPKRPSLGSSFNIKIKESDKNGELEKAGEEIQNISLNGNININEENFEKSSDTMSVGKKEKILSLNDVSELPNSVCC